MKRIFILMLVFVYAFTVSTKANALISPNDWSSLASKGWKPEAVNVASDGTVLRTGAGVAIEGEASALKKVSSAIVSPSAQRVAKSLARGLGTALVTAALTELLGKAVDWVLDPDNNAVKYKDRTCKSLQQSDLDSICKGVFPYQVSVKGKFGTIKPQITYIICMSGDKALNQDNDVGMPCTAEDVDKSKQLDEIAEKIRDMANKGNPDAQALLETVVKEMLANKEPEALDPLAANAKDKDPATDPTKDPTKDDDKDKDKDKDATSSTAQTPDPEKSKDKTDFTCSSMPLFQKVCDWIDWTKKVPEDPKEDPIEIKPKEKPDFDLPSLAYSPYVKFPAQCPQPPTFQVFGQTLAFPIQLFCDFCSQFGYVVLAYAWLRALLIVGSGFKGQ